MATYSELADIRDEPGFGDLVKKIRVAVTKKAVDYLNGVTPTAAQVSWAIEVLKDPSNAAESVLWYVVAANSSASVAQILSATDAAVQTNVDAAVDVIVAGGS